MDFMIKRSVTVFMMVLIAACVWHPRNGFSEDKRAGLYAGPLSLVAKAIIETAGSASQDAPEQLSGAPQKYRGETPVNKKRAAEFDTNNPLSPPS